MGKKRDFIYLDQHEFKGKLKQLNNKTSLPDKNQRLVAKPVSRVDLWSESAQTGSLLYQQSDLKKQFSESNHSDLRV